MVRPPLSRSDTPKVAACLLSWYSPRLPVEQLEYLYWLQSAPHCSVSLESGFISSIKNIDTHTPYLSQINTTIGKRLLTRMRLLKIQLNTIDKFSDPISRFFKRFKTPREDVVHRILLHYEQNPYSSPWWGEWFISDGFYIYNKSIMHFNNYIASLPRCVSVLLDQVSNPSLFQHHYAILTIETIWFQPSLHWTTYELYYFYSRTFRRICTPCLFSTDFIF